MSGGVDSAVAAGLLQRQGYEVVGAFARGWEPATGGTCNWRLERRDALRAAARLGLPLLTFDFSDDYERLVVRPLLSGYRRGETPNPDILCNREIKFGLLAHAARKQGFDYLATGHYARREESSSGLLLKRGRDSSKDQSYFLWTLRQADLERTIFPLGDLKKSEVRALARRWGLPQAHKPDSQGLCFVGQIDFKQFLRQELKPENGEVLNEGGKVIGYHNGAALYTVGERHGFTITDPSTTSLAHYVIKKDVLANTLTVSSRPISTTNKPSLVKFNRVNWVSGQPPALERNYLAQVRYRQKPVSGRLKPFGNDNWCFEFDRPITAAPGQSLVIYDSDTLIGGGVIKK